MKKHQKIPTRVGYSDSLIDTLNSRADTYNDFSDRVEKKFRFIWDTFLALIDVNKNVRKRLMRMNRISLGLWIFNLLALATIVFLYRRGIF